METHTILTAVYKILPERTVHQYNAQKTLCKQKTPLKAFTDIIQ